MGSHKKTVATISMNPAKISGIDTSLRHKGLFIFITLLDPKSYNNESEDFN
jgi:hypothetical protein